MKKLVLAIAFIGMGSFVMAQQSPLTAQQKADRQAKKTEMHDKRMSKMQQELGLTDSQVAQINALQDKRKGEMKANMQAQTADRRAQNQAANDEMKRILTPDQYTKWQANAAVVKLLAQEFGVAKTQISLAKGAKSKFKIFEIEK